MKIKLRKTDRLFTQCLRILQDYTCQKCGMKYVFNGVVVKDLRNLGVSHYWSRSHENTRFDTENTDLLCNFPCHHHWQSDGRREYEEFMLKKLGQERYDLLDIRAHTYKKRDDGMDGIILKEMLKEAKVVEHIRERG